MQSPRPWSLALGGLVSLAVAMGIGRFVYTPILPLMAEGLPLTKAQAGLIASANFVGYLAGALAAASRIPGSRRTWLVAALGVSAATTTLTAALSGVASLSAVRFAGGVASAFVLVFASSVILERLTAAGASRLSSVHFAGVGVGIAASAALVSALAAAGIGWRLHWAATGALALLAVPLVALLVPPDERGGGPAAPPGPVSLTPPLASLTLSYGLFGLGYVVTATFLVAIVRGSPEVAHLEPVVWIAVGLSAVPSVALWTAIGRRIGVYPAYALACLLEAAGVAGSVLVTSATGVILSALCLGGTFMGITALGLVGARTLSASDPRRVIALMTAAFGVGQIVGPSLAGWLFDRTGSFTLPSLLAAGALVLAALLGAAVDWRILRPQAATQPAP
ncbi:MAG TPA: YbfB/YjiJ family MFS transporter [Microvirga sp.]|jgi:predicted MFS family arabinose efflux permease|nr:YbfB/YjiJ family MFS transporter [Microvirga sp.]